MTARLSSLRALACGFAEFDLGFVYVWAKVKMR
jgi:hypothetical protein